MGNSLNGWARFVSLGAASLFIACLVGCPVPAPPDDSQRSFPFLDVDGNFSFDAATALPLAGDQQELSFSGSVDGPADIDIYDLGVLTAGDGLFVDVTATSGDLDAVAAVFDDQEMLQFFNDDREADASNLNPLIDDVVRGQAGRYFLGIMALGDSNTLGDYNVIVRITRNVGVPAPRGQVVFLDWAGGANVVVPNVGQFDLTPFDAGDLGESSDATEEIKDRVQQFVEDVYAGYNLVLLNSDDHPRPTGAHTTIYFGGNNRRAFAISEQVDAYNADAADDGIIFTRSYRLAFSIDPTVGEVSVAVGNTVAHEIGHLLGLVHTTDCNELMDSTCGNDRLLRPQEFGVAPLDERVFPLGSQNAADLLAWTLGLVGQ
jgi:hypothetical protein